MAERKRTPEPIDELTRALNTLWIAAGRPSTRVVAESTGGVVSHSTVYAALQGRKAPRWPSVSAIVRALGGDVKTIEPLWSAAYVHLQEHRPHPAKPARSPLSQPDGVEAIRGLTAAIHDLADAIREAAGKRSTED